MVKGKSSGPPSTLPTVDEYQTRASITKRYNNNNNNNNNNGAAHQSDTPPTPKQPASGASREQRPEYWPVLSGTVPPASPRTPLDEDGARHQNLAQKSSKLPPDISQSLHQHQFKRRRSISPTHSSAFADIPPTPPTDPATGPPETMSKLSQGLKQLINAPFAKPSYTVVNPSTLKPTITQLASEASDRGVSTRAWLTFSTATAMTMNAPSAMNLLWDTAQKSDRSLDPVLTAELQREVGLKCISFNGIPRTINCLGAFYSALPDDIRTKLSTKPTREFQPDNIEQRKSDGLGLWDSVYYGFERKLLAKLAQSHPDLPVHIIHGHYASLLSNPSRHTYIDGEEKPRETQVGRVLTSLVAIACLRAQTGVGPQVVSHIFGLRKAYERGDAEAEGEVEVQGGKWLSTEEGNKWLLEWIDELVKSIGTMQEGDAEQIQASGGTTFAPGLGKAKL